MSRQIAGAYEQRTLDCVVQCAYLVSLHFVARPHHYRKVDEDTSKLLSDFRSLTGCHTDWPDAPQRARMTGKFITPLCGSLASLRRAAISYFKRAPSSNDSLAADGFREEVLALRMSLEAMEGESLAASNRQIGLIFRNAIRVLATDEVARVFACEGASTQNWPLGGNFNIDAAYLCEEIARRAIGKGLSPLNHQKFLLLQKVAHFGALTLDGVLDDSDGCGELDRIVNLARNALSWTRALQNLLLQVNLIRVWKEPDYRRSLELAELDILPPHPSGEIDLQGTDLDASMAAGMVIFADQTYTLDDEVCCCSGAPCEDTNGLCGSTEHGSTCPITDCHILV